MIKFNSEKPGEIEFDGSLMQLAAESSGLIHMIYTLLKTSENPEGAELYKEYFQSASDMIWMTADEVGDIAKSIHDIKVDIINSDFDDDNNDYGGTSASFIDWLRNEDE